MLGQAAFYTSQGSNSLSYPSNVLSDSADINFSG